MIAPDIGTLTALGDLSRRPTAENLANHGPEALRRVAKEFESTFLAEMLKHSGVGTPLKEFGGGQGEAAFASMLTQEYAQQLSERGGIGLAEKIYGQLALKAGV